MLIFAFEAYWPAVPSRSSRAAWLLAPSFHIDYHRTFVGSQPTSV
jgi:hypothetical protein